MPCLNSWSRVVLALVASTTLLSQSRGTEYPSLENLLSVTGDFQTSTVTKSVLPVASVKNSKDSGFTLQPNVTEQTSTGVITSQDRHILLIETSSTGQVVSGILHGQDVTYVLNDKSASSQSGGMMRSATSISPFPGEAFGFFLMTQGDRSFHEVVSKFNKLKVRVLENGTHELNCAMAKDVKLNLIMSKDGLKLLHYQYTEGSDKNNQIVKEVTFSEHIELKSRWIPTVIKTQVTMTMPSPEGQVSQVINAETRLSNLKELGSINDYLPPENMAFTKLAADDSKQKLVYQNGNFREASSSNDTLLLAATIAAGTTVLLVLIYFIVKKIVAKRK